MEPVGSMPHSQGLSNNSYPEPNQSNYPHLYLSLQIITIRKVFKTLHQTANKMNLQENENRKLLMKKKKKYNRDQQQISRENFNINKIHNLQRGSVN